MNSPGPILLPPVEAPPPGGAADAGRLLQILWRGKWILIAAPLLALAGAKWWLAAQTPIYMATAQVQVDSRQVNVLKSGAGESINKPRTVLKQQQGLFKSTSLLKRLADSPTIQGLAMFSPERLGPKTVVGALFENLTPGIDVETDRLFVSFSSPDREDAITVVDEALRVYIEYHKDKKHERAEELAGIVRTEWEGTKAELEKVSADIAALESENTLVAGMDRTPLQTKLDGAHAGLAAAHKESQQLRAVHEDMLEASTNAERFRERGLYWRAKGPIAALEERMDSARTLREQREEELTRLERSFGAEHRRLAELRHEIASQRAKEEEVILQYAREYLRNSEVDYRRALLFEQSLAADVQDLLAQVADQNEVLNRKRNLEIEREHLRTRVASFDERIAQLELENQTGALNLDVIEYARAGVSPIYPETEKTLIYALGGGAILGFGLALLLGLSDRRVRKIEEVPNLLGTSVLGVLPEMPRGWDRAKIARLVEEAPDSHASESFRSVRTATTFALPGGRGVVLVTSASAREGKSVCASNLAFALARAGKRTLLIDGDMRNPRQHEIYAVSNELGLAALLTSSLALRRAVVPAVALGLDLLPAGDAHGKAAELCEGRVLAELVSSLRESYDCIVIDSPAVLESSEARVLAVLADAVVFVLRLDVTRTPAVKRAVGILLGRGARIVGCLPNGASSESRAFSGGITLGSSPSGGDGREPELGPQPSAKGTDFLGLEESA